MDIPTLAIANAYTDSQRLAYVERTNPLTFDGNIAGKELDTSMEITMVRISDEVSDLNTVKKIVVMAHDGERMVAHEITEGFTVDDIGDGVYILFENGTPWVAISHNGTYVAYIGEETIVELYVSRVEFAETIHPIDPKYLPGAVLPVVEITSDLGWTDTQTKTALNDADNATLTSTAQTSRNCICAVPVMGMKLFMNLQLVDRGGADGSGYAYLGSAPITGASGFYIFLNSDDGTTWSAATLLTA